MSRSYPEPLQPCSPFNPAGWLLPATALTLLSMAAFLAVPLALQATSDLRASFQLPVPAFATLWMASATALAVAWRCRLRPGLLLPRFWALGLAVFSGLSGLLALFWQSPWLSAGGAGALAASLILLGRLLRVRPDDKLVARLPFLAIGLLALYFSLVLWAAGSQHGPPGQQTSVSQLQEGMTSTAQPPRGNPPQQVQ